MNNNKMLRFLLLSFLLSTTTMLYAATQPMFEFRPLTPTALQVNPGEIVHVLYNITNKTQLARTLTMKPINGVKQTTLSTGVCANPFTLQPNQSCLLILTFDGNQMSSSIEAAPEVCKVQDNNTPDPFLCSRSSQANALNISLGTEPKHPTSYVYLSSSDSNIIYQCQPETGTGNLINCATLSPTPLDTPRGITINPAKTFMYITNFGDNTITQCAINTTTGNLFACHSADANGLVGPIAVAFNPAGTLAYIVNNLNNTVYQCEVNQLTGSFESSCIDSGVSGLSFPADMVINPSNTFAYIADFSNDSIVQCSVDNSGALSNCSQAYTLLNFRGNGLTMNAEGTKLYAADFNNEILVMCDVETQGSLSCTTFSTSKILRSAGISLNATETSLYVANTQNLDPYTQCSLDTTGTITTCSNAEPFPFNTWGIAVLNE